MEYRKLIKFGNSSHIISLPINWIKKNKLKKGDLIYFAENGNGELILNHEIKKEEHKSREMTIDIAGKPIPTIEREILSAYTNDYDTINVIGDLKKYREGIEKILGNLLALEIMEQTPTKIIVKNFLNLKEVSIQDNLRRIDLTIRSMFNYLKESFDKNVDNFDNIAYLDTNVNKIRFLLYRAINKCLKNNDYSIYPQINSFMELLNYRLIINNLEDVADDCRRISRFLRKAKLRKNEKNDLKKLYFDIENSYLNVMKAYYTNNKDLAHEVATNKDKIIKTCRDLFEKYDNKSVGAILEKYKGMESFIRNIARVVIDTEKENKNHIK
ncbi:MAG: hypothetical protein AABW45_01895 [Nanoarchaeota archaeon]